jgi:hypothetical protein
MVEEPSHVEQLSINHLCKIGCKVISCMGPFKVIQLCVDIYLNNNPLPAIRYREYNVVPNPVPCITDRQSVASHQI